MLEIKSMTREELALHRNDMKEPRTFLRFYRFLIKDFYLIRPTHFKDNFFYNENKTLAIL